MTLPLSEMPNIPDLLHCLKVKNIEVQINAAACLQHLTYQNENNKEVIRFNNGLPLILNLLKSRDGVCQYNAAGVLRNMSYGPNMEMKKYMEKCGVIEVVDSLFKDGHNLERGFVDMIMATICNMSCAQIFNEVLCNSVLVNVTQNVLLPFIGLTVNPSTHRVQLFKISDLSFSYSSLLEHLTAFLKNMSCGIKLVRHQMRATDGLVDCLVTIIQHSFDNENFHYRIVENCICVIRNLCYALQELFDPNYLNAVGKRRTDNPGQGNKYVDVDGMQFSKPRHDDIGGFMVLWNSELIDVLIEMIHYCKNYYSVEAAIGTVQNMAVGKWYLAEGFRVNFRKKNGLPLLVSHIIKGPDNIVRSTIIALRNLAEDNRNLELIGDNVLPHMIQCLPSNGKLVIKRVAGSNHNHNEDETLSIDTIYSVLSFIYFLLRQKEIICELFVKREGYRNCMFLLKTDLFYKENLCHHSRTTNACNLPTLSAEILRFLWSKPKLRTYFKGEKMNCEDFCVQGMANKFKSAMSCSDENGSRVYYGTPYSKARSNTLVPLSHRHGPMVNIVVTPENSEENNRDFRSRNMGGNQTELREIDHKEKYPYPNMQNKALGPESHVI